METGGLILLVFGVIVLAGGVMGWVKARSKPSLIAGAAFGAALIGTSFLFGPKPELARVLAFVLPGLLAIVMGIRYGRTGKFMPAGMIAILSVVVLVLEWLVGRR